MAVHDHWYATPPASWVAFRWRLQHIAEEEIGTRVRESQRHEDDTFKKLQGVG